MGVCSICNGFRELHELCGECGREMNDHGKIMDYYDDYSAYMPTDLMKMEDGYQNDYRDQLCPHLLTCSHCGMESVKLLEE
ncbi:hypothetical protein [Cytobacillus gottheilii]|uniref:hypothetical protein n=1 Tax=Cytobacillus gottheilii TaxID=859144 RepID=UPI0009BAB707|nr:hypothetical protein [Cytobacillus gottheilii]